MSERQRGDSIIYCTRCEQLWNDFNMTCPICRTVCDYVEPAELVEAARAIGGWDAAMVVAKALAQNRG